MICPINGFISTARKNSHSAFTAIASVLHRTPFYQSLVVFSVVKELATGLTSLSGYVWTRIGALNKANLIYWGFEKMKTFLKLFIVVILISVVLIGCGNNDVVVDDDTDDVVDESLRVALIVNQRFGDKGPSDSLKEGLEQASADFGVEITTLESSSPAMHEEDIRAMAVEGYDLIIATFPPMTDAMEVVAKEFPDTRFLGIWMFMDEVLPNVRTVEYEGYRVCYVLGYLAGQLTETNKLGRIVGSDSADMNPNVWAFAHGAQQANPDTQIYVGYVDSFEDPAKGKEIAMIMYESGVDIIMTDASRSGFGVIEAAQETGNYIIHDPAYHPDLAPEQYITALDLGWSSSVYYTIKDIVEGKFEGGHIKADFFGGTISASYGGFDSFIEHGSEEMVNKLKDALPLLDELIADIKSGALEVPYNEESGRTIEPGELVN